MDFRVKVGQPIQVAIDAAHAQGGGRVVIEPGVHTSSTLYLKSFVELHLSAGAKIQGGSQPCDYDDFSDPELDAVVPEGSRKCLIAANHAQNIAITGYGEINGAGPDFYDTNVPAQTFFDKPSHPRPRMVQFHDCQKVRLEGASFVDSPGWTIWLITCEDVHIHGITITGCQQMINNDGIDIDGCCRVTVSDCLIRTGDDSLVLRAIGKGSGNQVLCEGITVTNCVLDSWCQGIRVGCPSDDTIRNCSFSNLVIQGRGNGINIDHPKRYLSSGCNGYLDLHHLVFSNLVIDSKGIPIRINVEQGIKLRRLSNISFSNIQINSQQPCTFNGSAETMIEDICFFNTMCNHQSVISHARNITFSPCDKLSRITDTIKNR